MRVRHGSKEIRRFVSEGESDAFRQYDSRETVSSCAQCNLILLVELTQRYLRNYPESKNGIAPLRLRKVVLFRAILISIQLVGNNFMQMLVCTCGLSRRTPAPICSRAGENEISNSEWTEYCAEESVEVGVGPSRQPVCEKAVLPPSFLLQAISQCISTRSPNTELSCD